MSNPKHTHEIDSSALDLARKRIRSGVITLVIGIGWALWPVAAAFLSAPGPYAFSEGPGGGGTVLWFMLLTLPTGAIIGLVGVIRLATGAGGYIKAPVAEDPNNPAVALEKRMVGKALVANLAVVPALVVSEPIVGFVLNNMILGGYSGIIVICTWGLAKIGFVGYSLWCIFKTQKTGLKILLIATSLVYALMTAYSLPGYLQIFAITGVA